MENDLTPEYVFEELFPKVLEENADIPAKINAVLMVDLVGEGGGKWVIDLTENCSVRRGTDENAKCVISMDANEFRNLLSINKASIWLDAFMNKRIKVKGHLPTALKLEYIVMAMKEGIT